MKRKTKTVEQVGGMLHKPGRKVKTDAAMNAAIRGKAKASDEGTKSRKKRARKTWVLSSVRV